MKLDNFQNLVAIIAKLRNKDGGCPWDLEQTHETLLKFLVEECYEFIAAVEDNSPRLMEEEIGDVLLQVLLHSQIASEKNHFNIESVSKVLAEKLIRRHPHVFKVENSSISSKEVIAKWQDIKSDEKKDLKQPTISKDYLKFPSLYGATKIGKATNKIKFDWNSADDVFQVVFDELNELKHEMKEQSKKKIEEEFGDLLFSVAQLGRHLELDPESCLRNANRKFMRRFERMEELINNDSKSIANMNQLEMDEYWKEVKIEEKNLRP